MPREEQATLKTRPEEVAEGPHKSRSLWRHLGSDLARLVDRPRRRLETPSTAAHNERVLYAEMLFQAVSNAGAMSYIAVFLVRLGAPNWLVGLYDSLPALLTILTVLPMGAFVLRQRNLVAVVNWGRLLWRSVIGMFAFLPFLPLTISPYVLVVGRSLIAIPGSAIEVASTTILGRATTARRRPRMLSMRMAIHGLASAALGFLAGQWLDSAPYPLNYQVLFISAFVAALGSIYTYSHLRLPPGPPQKVEHRKRAALADMWTMIREAPSFRNYTIAAFVFRMGMNIPSALFTIYRVRTLGSSDAWIGVLLTVERLLGVAMYFLLGRFLARRIIRRWLWLSCVGAALFPLTMTLATTPQMLLIPSITAGLFGAGMDIFLTNTLFETSPEEDRPTFVATNTFLANITALIGPMLGTALAGATTIQTALLIVGLLRIIGGLSFWWLGVGTDTKRPARWPMWPTRRSEGTPS